ncbi:hypothetical protein D3C78_1338340 [compost metagenome]
MADADAQAIEIRVIAKFVLNILQPVVPTVAATQFDFCNTRRNIQLVVRDQNFVRLNTVEIGHRQYGFATEVHKGGRHQQAHVITGQIQAGGVAVEFALFLQLLVMALGQ